MKHVAWMLAGLPLMVGAAPLHCDIGPVVKTYGAAPWLVYSCDDLSTVVLTSAPGSPASPFYFIFSLEAGGYRLRGEGTGSKSVTDAALHQLQSLSAGQIQALRQATLRRGH